MNTEYDANLRKLISTALSAPILSPERELTLTRRIADSQDRKAVDELTRAHMRMAVSSAIKMRGYGLPLVDLIQEGAIGLLEAARRFDPAREVRFSTYAGWWIRASMQDYILRNWSVVRVGSKSAHKKVFFNLGRIRAMIDTHDKAPRDARIEAANKFGVSENDIDFMTSRLSARDQSLNVPIGEDGDMERVEMLADDRETPDAATQRKFDEERRGQWLRAAMLNLEDRERLILERRFFADGKIPLSQLGDELSLSKERVRQIEKRAVGKLRQVLVNQGESINF